MSDDKVNPDPKFITTDSIELFAELMPKASAAEIIRSANELEAIARGEIDYD